jgi:hypothetical protein
MTTPQQPIFEHDAVTLGFEWPIFIISILAFPFQIRLLVKERDSPYIKFRGFWTSILLQVSIFVQTGVISIFVLFNAPCWLFPSFVIPLGLFSSFLMVERAYVLHVTHTVAKMAKDMLRGDAHKSWYFENRNKLLKDSPLSYTKLVVYAVTLALSAPVLIFSFGAYNEQMKSPWYTEECLSVSVQMVLSMIVVTIIASVPTAIVKKRLEKVEENFFMMEEMKKLHPLGAIMGILSLLYVCIPNVRQVYQRPVLLQFVACGFFTRLINFGSSFWLVAKIRKARKDVSSHTRRSQSQDGLSIVEMNGTTPKSAAERPASPSSPSHGKNGQFNAVLENQDAFEAFDKFLLKELSTENLHCWKAIEVLNESFLKGDEKGNENLWKNAFKIYELFCAVNANLPVNISSFESQRLHKIFASGKSYDPETFADMMNALSGVQKELYILMSMDSFRRFKRTPEFKQLNLSKEE